MRARLLLAWFTVMILVAGRDGLAQDSLGMSCISRLVYWTGASDIQLVGDTLWGMGGLSGMHVVSLSNPAQPREILCHRWYDRQDFYSYVCVSGRVAYTMDFSGIQSWDITDPVHMTLLGEWNDISMGDMMISGDVGLCIDYGGNFFLLNVHDPAHLQLLGNIPQGIPARLCGISGNYVYIQSPGLNVWDITNPAVPLRVAYIDSQYTTAADGLVDGHFVYFPTSSAGVRIIDVADPVHPVEVASCDSGSCLAVAVTEHQLAVSDLGGLNLFDISNPVHPVLESHLTRPQSCSFQRLAASGTLVCGVPLGGNGLSYGTDAVNVIDISNPAAPVEVGAVGHNGCLGRMTLNSYVAYVTDNFAGCLTVDLTDPHHPHNLGMTAHEVSEDVTAIGHYAYLTDLNRGMISFDVSNPAQPDSIGLWYHNDCEPGWIVAYDHYTYVANEGLRVIDVANPASPAYVTTVGDFSMDYYGGWTIADDHLFTGGFAGIPYGVEFDVGSLSNPAAPQRVGLCHPSLHSFAEEMGDIAVLGNYAYVAGPQSGMWVIDVSDPTHPQEANWISGPMWALTGSGTTLVTQTTGQLNVLDVSDPINPQSEGYYETEESYERLTTDGHYVYAISPSQFDVFAVDALTSAKPHKAIAYEFALHPCYPNPFNPSTVIWFSLSQTRHAKLTVYDVTGRQVKVLVDRVLSAGEHRKTFDGSTLASGVYFARLEAGKNVKTEKLMLLK